MSWSGLRGRFWFSLATLALRVRFFTGKASFVEADVEMTTNHAGEVYDFPGFRPQRRVLAHFQLKTRQPQAGRQGWEIFRRRFGDDANPLVVLACGFCGHFFVVHVLSSVEPQPASYGSDWFSFMNSEYEGEPRLYCLHCEQDGRPGVKYLTARGRGR